MKEQGSGSIVAFSSIRSVVVEPGQGVYAATKAGTLLMIRALAAELGPYGVRANAVAPGIVDTPLTKQIKDQPSHYRAYAEKNVFGRWATPDEIAGVVAFLASGCLRVRHRCKHFRRRRLDRGRRPLRPAGVITAEER